MKKVEGTGEIRKEKILGRPKTLKTVHPLACMA
jgi:hypothetical protein